MLRLNYRDIRINRPLSWDVFDGDGNLLLRKGYVIQSDTQVRGLVERGLYVVVNLDGVVMKAPAKPETRFDPFWLWDDIHTKLVRILRDVETEDMVEDKLTGIALLVNVLIDKDPDAALGAVLLKDSQCYTYSHALHVAVIADIVSKKLAWREDERRDLVCAALSMNVAMVTLQTELLSQKTPLTEEQRRAIDAHPAQGSDLLLRKGVRNRRWLDAIRLHHERQQLTANALTSPDAAVIAELLRTLDVFCAKISPRTYRQAKLPSAAAREIFVAERDHKQCLPRRGDQGGRHLHARHLPQAGKRRRGAGRQARCKRGCAEGRCAVAQRRHALRGSHPPRYHAARVRRQGRGGEGEYPAPAQPVAHLGLPVLKRPRADFRP